MGPSLKADLYDCDFLAVSACASISTRALANSAVTSEVVLLPASPSRDLELSVFTTKKPVAIVVFRAGGGVKAAQTGPLGFNFSSSDLRITGSTNSSAQLKVFIEKLYVRAVLLPKEQSDDE